MTEEITEVKSAYEKEIEKFLKSGGKVKYHHPDKKKIAKMTASFKKSFKITKDKEDELDAKEKAEREFLRYKNFMQSLENMEKNGY